MLRPRLRSRLFLGGVAFALCAITASMGSCARASGGSGGGPGGAASGASSTGAGAAAAVTASTVLPVVFVHGFNGEPANWDVLLQRLARGRTVYPAVFAGDSDAFPTGGIEASALFSAGYYHERAASPRFYTDRVPTLPSIGGCPAPRTDQHGPSYGIAYAEQLDRIIENVCRATGSPRVDLVAFSLGGVVSRAYTRWLSTRALGGMSRVRRLLTCGTPNHGLNSLEASLVALANNGDRAHVDQGEAAELNYECTYWDGRSYIDRLNDGWDGFCTQAGIRYAAAHAYGGSIWQQQSVQSALGAVNWFNSAVAHLLLVHPTPNFDFAREQAESWEDGDGVVRVASARLDPARYPGVAFNAGMFGIHGRDDAPERSLSTASFTEAVIRRFIFEDQAAPGFQVTASARAVTTGGEQTWLELEVDVTGGTPLAAEIIALPTGLASPLTALGVGVREYGTLLHPGPQRIAIDLDGLQGPASVEVRLYGLDGEVALAPFAIDAASVGRSAPPIASAQLLGPVAGNPQRVAISAAPGTEIAWALVTGTAPVTWSGWTLAGADLQLPQLPPGGHELRLRSRSAANAAGIVVEGPRPDALRLTVAADGSVTATR